MTSKFPLPKNYTISTEKNDIDLSILHSYLAYLSYWAKNIPMDILTRAIHNSLTFSLLNENQQFIGFARVITDFATFAYLADVFVIEKYRKQDLGKCLIEFIMYYPGLQKLRNWLLFTKDTHEFYAKFG